MDANDRNALIAAACILLGFGLLAFLMPRVMLAVGQISTLAAGALAVAFVAAFFGIFFLRGRQQKKRGN